LHVLVPALFSVLLFRKQALLVFALLMAGMLIDVDHLLATPVYDPLRCSMGFHPLHTWPAVCVYVLLWVFPRTRIAGLGLIIHMALDTGDCLSNPGGLAQLQQNFW
jgi:hypothetical protein